MAAPDAGSDAGSGVGPTASCGGPHSSEIQLIDELGLPMGGVTLQMSVGGGASSPVTTDASGKICFSSSPGTSVSLRLDDLHESQAGESIVTPSGHHFRANAGGP